MRKILNRLLASGAVIAVSLPLALSATAAHAGVAPAPAPCSLSGCNGLDPTLSYLQGSNPKAFCSDGATNVGDLPNGKPALGGLLELRWGPSCQTNWTRFTPGNNDTYQIFVVSVFGGVMAGNGLGTPYQFGNAKGVPHYSDQVYSPGPAGACVEDVTTGSGLSCYYQSS